MPLQSYTTPYIQVKRDRQGLTLLYRQPASIGLYETMGQYNYVNLKPRYFEILRDRQEDKVQAA